MTTLSFGQPLGGVVQYAYTVPDLEQAIAHHTKVLNVGPWFVRGPFSPPEGRYRGQPAPMRVSLARAFSGHAMIELIQQHDDSLSVFREKIERQGYGFHHYAIATRDLDADVARYLRLGYEVAFSDRLPSGARVVYVDATPDLPGMVELVEMTAAQEALYTRIYTAAAEWDGTHPIRREDA